MKLPRDRSERTLRAARASGDLRRTATLALERYGADIMTFLAWRLASPADASEAFSMFAEDLWLGLPNFEWRCTLRTWLYVIANNAARRYLRSPHMRFAKRRAIASDEQLSAIVDELRTRTPIYRRTEVKSSIRALRERLDPEDQLLLVLRVDRAMSWRELAVAISGNLALSEEQLKREEARLRKCFQRIKDTLRRLAEEQGLLPA
jgi:RNA polymerase sigma-70 factor (ECF subfamily)